MCQMFLPFFPHQSLVSSSWPQTTVLMLGCLPSWIPVCVDKICQSLQWCDLPFWSSLFSEFHNPMSWLSDHAPFLCHVSLWWCITDPSNKIFDRMFQCAGKSSSAAFHFGDVLTCVTDALNKIHDCTFQCTGNFCIVDMSCHCQLLAIYHFVDNTHRSCGLMTNPHCFMRSFISFQWND